jgi:hypothetical protein
MGGAITDALKAGMRRWTENMVGSELDEKVQAIRRT